MASESTTAAVALAVRDLVKVYPGAAEPALDGLNVTVRRGEMLGLLGPNGAGKTTAIAIMTTLLAPTRGTVTVGGFDVRREPAQVRTLIGLVPQEIALYPTLTIRENLRYFGRLHGLRGAALEARLATCLDVMGLGEQADRRVQTRSGGIKRRANLAAGLLPAPALLFLDEPTVGIDAQSRSLIFDSLARLRTGGTTLVYTTHYMEEAERYCSQVVIMDAGRAVAAGTPAELVGQQPDCRDLEAVFLKLTGRHLRD